MSILRPGGDCVGAEHADGQYIRGSLPSPSATCAVHVLHSFRSLFRLCL
jgi:hypothetical protein